MASRFENKYLVTEATALQIRQFIQQYLELDEFGIGKPNLSYPVHSLYLDSSSLEIYWRTINGDKNRFKLRLRYYNDDPKTPVFFEIKRRMNNIILKQRACIRRQGIAMILSGQFPPDECFASKSQEDRASLQRFLQLMQAVHAAPFMHVAYDREAYVHAHDNDVRVTLDRNVRCEVDTTTNCLVGMKNPHPLRYISGDLVILELKFTDRYPNWFRDLVQTFNVMQGGAAKFVEGTMQIGNNPFEARDVVRGYM